MTNPSRFEFATANRILFGVGTVKEIGSLAAEMGKHALIVGGKTPARAAPLIDYLDAAGVKSEYFPIPDEPTVAMVDQGMQAARKTGCDMVIGFGGGSAMDAGKAIAILLNNPGDIYDYLEVIGRGKQFNQPALPCIAIPTTSGTGTEVTKNAVIASPADRVKVSLRHTTLLPRLALLDPELTYSAPPKATAYAGMDALTQLIEPFVSPKANPFTDGLCREGLWRAARSLRKAYADGFDAPAREDMCVASLFGGLGLANAGLGAVHGFSGVMGGMYPIPHGALCARLLPYALEVNFRALQARDPLSPSLGRYLEMAAILTGKDDASIEDVVWWLHTLIDYLHIPTLGDFKVSRTDFPTLVTLSRRSSSMKANVIQLSDDELTEILEKAL
jgi:alcohol dehydrogenase class IV